MVSGSAASCKTDRYEKYFHSVRSAFPFKASIGWKPALVFTAHLASLPVFMSEQSVTCSQLSLSSLSSDSLTPHSPRNISHWFKKDCEEPLLVLHPMLADEVFTWKQLLNQTSLKSNQIKTHSHMTSDCLSARFLSEEHSTCLSLCKWGLAHSQLARPADLTPPPAALRRVRPLQRWDMVSSFTARFCKDFHNQPH